jgi:hypothetical protein
MSQPNPLDDLMNLAELAEQNSGWDSATVWQERVKTRAPVAEVNATEVARARSGWDPLSAWRQRVLKK